MKTKFAFFDVDKTIIKGDSMFDLLFYTWRSHPISFIPSLFHIFISVLKYIFSGRKDIRIVKEGIFYVVKYLDETDIENFVKTILLKKRLYSDAFKKIECLKKQNFTILLVSASPHMYIKYIESALNVNMSIGTTIDNFGKIIGENCKHNEKVIRINKWLKKNNLSIDYENSVGFSDSYSADSPMLELVKNRFLINSNLSIDGYQNLSWK